MTPEVMGIAKSYLKKKTGKSKIYGNDIKVVRGSSRYSIVYHSNYYVLK